MNSFIKRSAAILCTSAILITNCGNTSNLLKNTAEAVSISGTRSSSSLAAVKRPNRVKVSVNVVSHACRLRWNKVKCYGYRIYVYKNGSWKLSKRLPNNKTTYRYSYLASGNYKFRVVPVVKINGKIFKSLNNKTINVKISGKKKAASTNNSNERADGNSGLISWKWNGTTNNYNVRNHKIDKITIHHQAEVNKSNEYIAKKVLTHGGSFNYCIDSDGKIGCMIDEKYRAWTSSSPENDMRAVTIEVANDEYGGEWHVSDEAMDSLIKLCADICRRNGIERLNFTGNANGNLTMHKYFTDTQCPGPYLSSQFPYIAEEVNKLLDDQ